MGCDVGQLPDLMVQIAAFAHLHSWQEQESMHIQLLVEELVVNAMTHGAANTSSGWVRLTIQNMPEGIQLELTDNGIYFNPLATDPPDIELDLDSRDIGGLGIHFLRQFADALEYTRIKYQDEDINRLVVFKKRT